MNDEENVLIASTVSPCLFQYRVWDTAHGAFVDHILLAQDGRFLLNLGDTVVPSIEPERYLVEFATGYTDKNSTMIFQGDLVKNKWGAIREVTWYDFEDCCVSGTHTPTDEAYAQDQHLLEDLLWLLDEMEEGVYLWGH